jgi:hypothetical protein
VRLAIQLNIPFVLWGAHQGLEQVGMYSHLESVEMTRRYRREHDLMGYDERDIFEFDPNFSEDEIASLSYPSDMELLDSGVRGVYLGNYVRWDPTAQHSFVSKTYGYGGRKSMRAHSFFDNPDCPVYFGLQDFLKQTKFGYSKATDQLTREIRHGRISRARAISIERRYLSRKPEGVREFAEWMGVSLGAINTLVLQHSNEFALRVLEADWYKEQFKGSLRSRISNLKQSGKYLDFDYQNIGKGI